MKFHNSDLRSFRGDAGTSFELTEIDENSKWPPIFHFRFNVRRHTTGPESHKKHSGENRILISLFVNEIHVSAINEDSKWSHSGHLVFCINIQLL